MTNKTGYTGLPWDYYNAVQGEDDIAIIHRKGEPDDTMVCKITDEGGPKTSPEANAQFIVTAANYHYRLVELLDSQWARQVGRRADELAQIMRTGQA